MNISSFDLHTGICTSVLNINIYQAGFGDASMFHYCTSGNGKCLFGISGYYIDIEYRAHVFISKDYGETYQLMNLPFTSGYNVKGIVASYTGQYISVCFDDGATIWDSDDYGSSWKENIDFATPFRVNNDNETITTIEMSNTGQYRSIALQNYGLYYSNDFGKTYVASQFNFGSSILKISMSSSGKFQVVIVSSSSNIYYSSNYGINWDLYNAPNVETELINIQISKTGEYIYFTNNDNLVYRVTTTEIFSIDGNVNIGKATVITGNLNVSENIFINGIEVSQLSKLDYIPVYDSLSTFTTFTNNYIYNYQDISDYDFAISSDGKYIVTCSGINVILSNNYGNTFQSIDVDGFGNIRYIGKNSLSISDVDSRICLLFFSDETEQILKVLSLDLQSGVFTSVLNINIYERGFGDASMFNYCTSGNGQYLFGISSYYFDIEYRAHVFISKDYGETYQLMNLPFTSGYNVEGIVASYTGKYISVCFDDGATIWDSDDYGSSWKENIDFATPFRVDNVSEPIRAIAMSNTGQFRSICLENHGLYYSNDFGKTYVASQFNFGSSILKISMSSSGKFQVVIVSGSSNIYYSSNYGINWDVYIESNITNTLNNIQISKTGEYIYITDNDNDNLLYRVTTTEIFSINGNVNIGKNTIITGNLNVSGAIVGQSITQTSDYRIKKNPTALDDSFVVDYLRPVHYTNILSNKEDLGFIAHEVQEVFPYLVHGEKDETENQSLNYIGIIAVLVKEMQEVKKKLKELTFSLNK